MPPALMTVDEIRIELSSMVISLGQLAVVDYRQRARLRSRQHELRAEIAQRHQETAA
ncbi:MAG: hypothetical protein OEV40_13840 [Acidimicrobiia bacterium]|nr:hypothetical protein [Acidimicrobiia bacterium]